MRKFSEVELFYIENHRGLSAKELAKALGATVPSVKAILKNLPPADAKPQEPTKSPASPALAALGRNEERGTIVMTSAGSQVADDLAKASPKKLPDGVGRFRD